MSLLHQITKTMLEAVQGEISTIIAPARLSIFHQHSGKLKSEPSQHKPVVQVAVGNIADTQRRRRNATSETYSTSTLGDP